MARVSPIGRRTKTRPAAVRWFWATLSSPKHPSRRRNSICTTRSTRSSWRPPGRRRDSRILSSPARAATAATVATATTVVPVLAAISFSHLLNDTIQSLLPAIYPILKSSYQLSFAQVGLVTLTLNITASVLQPLVGLYTDRRATPYSLVVGMTFSLFGLLLLSVAARLASIMIAAGLVGIGSAVFHPESSRVARMASGGRHGLAQSVFQVGGNFGSAAGPLLAAFLVLPRGQSSIAWASAIALLAIAVLWRVGNWSSHQHRQPKRAADPHTTGHPHGHLVVSEARVRWSIVILIALI